MHLSPQSCFERFMFGELFAGYPENYPVESEDKISILPFFATEDLPFDLVSFNDRGRAVNHSEIGIHHYKRDNSFASVLQHPLKWVEPLSQFKCVTPPDISISPGMARWQRIRNTAYSRAVGAAWVSRGLRVLPAVRWVLLSDLEFVGLGIARGSCIAISSYGAVRDAHAAQIFAQGAHLLQEQIQPEAILVYGSLDRALELSLSRKSQVKIVKPGGYWKSPKENPSNNPLLF